jgi:hypothetical protein
MTVPVVVKWIDGAPDKFEAGQFIVYEDGDWELVGTRGPSNLPRVIKHAILIKPHELEWLQSMAVGRHMGVAK